MAPTPHPSSGIAWTLALSVACGSAEPQRALVPASPPFVASASASEVVVVDAPPAPKANARRAVAITAGGAHACAILDDGSAWCWGDNAHGELGDGSRLERRRPVRLPVLERVAQIAISRRHACAIAGAPRSVYCWGGNEATASEKHTTTPTLVASLDQVGQLALGDAHSCALLVDATVRCWGNNAHGQMGDGELGDAKRGHSGRRTPTAVAALKDVVEIAAGADHTCARLRGGTVRCWGDNRQGQLGDGKKKNSAVPLQVAGVNGARRIAAGGDATCYVDPARNAVCWGSNGGMLALEPSTRRLGPTVVPGLTQVEQLALASSHACAVDSSHRLACIGSNCSGQGAQGQNCPADEKDKLVDREMGISDAFVRGMERTVAAAVTSAMSCGLDLDGSVHCWGDASSGKLGDGRGPAGLSADPSYTCFGSDDACFRGLPAPVSFE